MPEPNGWRLYTSTAEYTSADTAWADVPSGDVQVLVIYYDSGRNIEHGEPEFRLPGEKEVKEGRTISDEAFFALVDKAWAAEPV